jgi:beta-lactam-binding protein with PASTA domain
MFKWLTRRSFWVNLLAAIVLIIVLWIVFFSSLGFVTKHGETIKVPSVLHLKINAADKNLASQNFEAVVKDSAYVDSLPPLIVVKQTPEPGSIVKPGRTIYLTLNKTVPPMTAMPELINYSFRSASMTLKSQGSQVGDTIYKPDIAEDAVLKQLYNGKPIKAGTMIPEGSKITLILGNGLGNVANIVPDLTGLTYLQATDLLSASNLNVGVVLMSGPITDTANAYVFKQNPPQKNELGEPNRIRAGASIDLWISQTNPNDTTGLTQPQQPQNQ